MKKTRSKPREKGRCCFLIQSLRAPPTPTHPPASSQFYLTMDTTESSRMMVENAKNLVDRIRLKAEECAISRGKFSLTNQDILKAAALLDVGSYSSSMTSEDVDVESFIDVGLDLGVTTPTPTGAFDELFMDVDVDSGTTMPIDVFDELFVDVGLVSSLESPDESFEDFDAFFV